MSAPGFSRPRRFDLIGLGECMVEFSADGALGSAAMLRRAYGGDVLNSLVAAARLGARTGFITRVGDDPFGAGMLAAWRGEGIDTSHAPLAGGVNGVYFISVDADGEREFCYRREGSPASRLGPDDIDASYIGDSAWLLLSGITQALSPAARAATLAAAQCARRLGVRVAYDPNYRPGLWLGQGGVAVARAAFHEVLPYTDWLLPSYPADGVLLDEGAPDGSLEQAAGYARRFAALAPHVALKCGADGVLLASGAGAGECVRVPGVAVARVVDSTGAGDAWNGGFIRGLLRGEPAPLAAAAANRVAALSLGFRGAIAPRMADYGFA